MKLIVFSSCLNCSGEAMIQIHGHFGGYGAVKLYCVILRGVSHIFSVLVDTDGFIQRYLSYII